MAYTPINSAIYSAAFAGACAGMGVSLRVLTSGNSSDYAGLAAVAGAFAQEFDTLWNNAASPSLFEIQGIQAACEAAWDERSPQAVVPNLAPSTYASLCRAIIAVILAGDTYLAGQGIIPPVFDFTVLQADSNGLSHIKGNAISWEPIGDATGGNKATILEVAGALTTNGVAGTVTFPLPDLNTWAIDMTATAKRHDGTKLAERWKLSTVANREGATVNCNANADITGMASDNSVPVLSVSIAAAGNAVTITFNPGAVNADWQYGIRLAEQVTAT